MTDTLSTWTVAHLRGSRAMAHQDALRSEELARQDKQTMASAEREPGRCAKCGRTKPRASTLAACENCREKDARAKRKKKEGEDAERRAERLAKRRAEEKARRDRLLAAGDKREAERLARWRAGRKAQRDKRIERARRELAARGYEVEP